MDTFIQDNGVSDLDKFIFTRKRGGRRNFYRAIGVKLTGHVLNALCDTMYFCSSSQRHSAANLYCVPEGHPSLQPEKLCRQVEPTARRGTAAVSGSVFDSQWVLFK